MAVREALLARTLVSLADTLVTDFDVVDFLTLLSSRCVELFGAGDAGLMLVDDQGHTRVAASSSHQMRLLELFEIQHDEGPCPDAFRTGEVVQCADLRVASDRWPHFAPEAVTAGFHSAVALPMRLRTKRIGALNLLWIDAVEMPDDDIQAAQALADVATIGLLHLRATEESRLLAEQLQYALDSRVVIEQAKGVVAERLGLDMDQAFDALRRYSRNHNQRLAAVSRSVVSRSVDPSALLAP